MTADGQVTRSSHQITYVSAAIRLMKCVGAPAILRWHKPSGRALLDTPPLKVTWRYTCTYATR
jgi:hypothetical protein